MAITKLVLIFGAGASYDCIAGGKHLMPLSRDIYNPNSCGAVSNAMDHWESIRDRAPQLSKQIGDNVEIFLSELLENKPSDLLLSRTLFFLAEMSLSASETAGNNNYHRVLNYCLNNSNLLLEDIISFNYDILLDKAVQSYLNIGTGPVSYLDNIDKVRLIKPHGSADWYIPIPLSQGHVLQFGKIRDANKRSQFKVEKLADKISLKGGYDITDIQFGDKSHILDTWQGQARMAQPVILLPIVTKAIADFVAPIYQAMEDALSDADHIVLIGYKASDEDFICALKSRPKGTPLKISVVGKSDTRNTSRALVDINPDDFTAEIIEPNGFSPFVENLEKDVYAIE